MDWRKRLSVQEKVLVSPSHLDMNCLCAWHIYTVVLLSPFLERSRNWNPWIKKACECVSEWNSLMGRWFCTSLRLSVVWDLPKAYLCAEWEMLDCHSQGVIPHGVASFWNIGFLMGCGCFRLVDVLRNTPQSVSTLDLQMELETSRVYIAVVQANLISARSCSGYTFCLGLARVKILWSSSGIWSHRIINNVNVHM